MDNRITSAIIPGGYSVDAYEFPNYSGNSVELQGYIYDLRDYEYSWDDSISALDYNQY